MVYVCVVSYPCGPSNLPVDRAGCLRSIENNYGTIEKVMEYGDQSLIELDKSVGDPVDLLVNGELFARGEVVTVSENFGVRITELVNPVH